MIEISIGDKNDRKKVAEFETAKKATEFLYEFCKRNDDDVWVYFQNTEILINVKNVFGELK